MTLSRAFTVFIRQVLLRFHEDRCLQLASSLTFTTLLALVPLLTVMLTIASAFPAFAGMTGQIDDFIASHVLPEQISKTVVRYIDQFSQRAGRLTLIGLSFLAATSFLTMLTIERAFNIIWRGAKRRTGLHRIVVYWAILTLGPVLIGLSLTMTSYLVTASLGLAKAVPIVGVIALWLIPFMLTIAAFTLLYFVFPARPVEFRHALIGGIVAGVFFELAKRGFALYVSRVPTYTMVYGTFATFPIFLLWIYVSWLVTVMGAIVTASLPNFGVQRVRNPQAVGAIYSDALSVLIVLGEAQLSGRILGLDKIASLARLQREQCEQILAVLSAATWVGRLENGGWILSCDPDRIRLSQIFRRFVINPEALAGDASEAALGTVFKQFGTQLDGILGMSLRDLMVKKISE